MKFWIRAIRVLALITGLMVMTTAAASDLKDSDYFVYLASSINGAVMSHKAGHTFDCTDVVYLMIHTRVPAAGAKKARIVWTSPKGKDEISAERGFESRGSALWSWSGLQLNRPAGSTVVSLIDPSNAMTPFIGEWRVVVNIDARTIASLNFSMLC